MIIMSNAIRQLDVASYEELAVVPSVAWDF
jgi:hypothetical protein